MAVEQKEYENRLELIKKFYKDDKLFLELYLNNYCGYHIYIRLDYIKKLKVYKIRWFDLDMVVSNKIEAYEGSEYVEDKAIKDIEIFTNGLEMPEDYKSYEEDKNKVHFYLDCKTIYTKNIDIDFYKCIPEELYFLKDIFTIIFRFLPNRLGVFLDELMSMVNSYGRMYRPDNKFTFDLFRGDLNRLFSPEIIGRGEKYYEEGKVLFLEKFEDRYFSVVEGSEKYLTIVRYDEPIKEMQIYCSCPYEGFCKHMYAIVKGIREGNFKPFYKVMENDGRASSNILDVIEDFDYLLSVGVEDDKLGIVGEKGFVEWVDILDKNGKARWIVLEDDKDKSLSKAIVDVTKK